MLTLDNTYRSPCGTGCSARLACLAADQRLAPGDEIVQESVIGSRYRLSYQPGASGGVIPRTIGQAHVMAESRLIFAAEDPFRAGIALSIDTSPQAPMAETLAVNGGGVVGLNVALALQHEGFAVTVYDRDEGSGDPRCQSPQRGRLCLQRYLPLARRDHGTGTGLAA